MTDDTDTPVRLAIAGLGRWGQTLVRSVQGVSPEVRFTGAVVRRAEPVRAFAEGAGIALFDDLAGVLEAGVADGVVLATPHSQHEAQALQVLEAGLPVLVEKPLALTRAGAARVTAAAAARGLVATVGFNRRFAPAMRRLRHLARSGELGTIQLVEGNFSGSFAYRYTPNTNTGLASGLDLDNSNTVGGGNDAFGFGNYAGQYGFTIYSKYEITNVRTFQTFLWKDMPGNLLTNDPTASPLTGYYSPAAVDALRLSSKNHVDVTLNVNGEEVHLLAAHPTPPTFDGPEDRNGKRNADEIRFWADYVSADGSGDYIYDDQGSTGGLTAGAKFVIVGDYNADPFDGDSYNNAISQLLDNPQVNASMTPASEGGVQAANDPHNNGSANQNHAGDPQFDTADFSDAAPGNLRVDYVLPSANMQIDASGVFWPTDSDQTDANTTGELFDLIGTYGNQGLYAGYPSSDHKLVWADIQVSAVPEPGTWMMMLGGLGLIGHLARRRPRG